MTRIQRGGGGAICPLVFSARSLRLKGLNLLPSSVSSRSAFVSPSRTGTGLRRHPDMGMHFLRESARSGHAQPVEVEPHRAPARWLRRSGSLRPCSGSGSSVWASLRALSPVLLPSTLGVTKSSWHC